jgi:hypothetical protein
LGSSVREKPVEKRKVAKTLTTQSILIPGLEGSNQASSSVLYSSYFNYKEENLCSQSKFSNIQT